MSDFAPKEDLPVTSYAKGDSIPPDCILHVAEALLEPEGSIVRISDLVQALRDLFEWYVACACNS